MSRISRLAACVGVAGLALLTDACAVGTFEGAPSAAYQRTVEVENRHHQQVLVTLEAGGQSYELGRVPPFGLAVFRIPARAAGASARIDLRVAGEVISHDTELVRFAGVDVLRLTIGRDVRNSQLMVRG